MVYFCVLSDKITPLHEKGAGFVAISAIRTAVIYLLLVAAMRIMGKRQLGELQPVELVVTLLVVDMAAIAVENTDSPLSGGLIPIAVLVSLELIFSVLVLKSPTAARLMDGRPVIVINNGTLDQHAMKKLRLSLEDLLGTLRQQGIFDLTEVQYAIAETGGKISVCLKPDQRPATAADVHAVLPDNGIPFLIVSDGRLSRRALSMCGLSEEWLQLTLDEAGCAMSEVFLLTADRCGKVCLLKKEKTT